MKNTPITLLLTLSLALTVAASACAYQEGDLGTDDDSLSETVPSTDQAQAQLFGPSYLTLLNLANCYATGVDAIGVSDLDQGRAVLENCLASDVVVNIDFPGVGEFAFDNLVDFTTFVDQFFSGQGYVRTQHQASNIVRGPFGYTMRSYISATHVLPDGSVDLNTVTYDDELAWVDGGWKITRRDIFIGSDVTLRP